MFNLHALSSEGEFSFEYLNRKVTKEERKEREEEVTNIHIKLLRF